jgi:hypothetical protein
MRQFGHGFKSHVLQRSIAICDEQGRRNFQRENAPVL